MDREDRVLMLPVASVVGHFGDAGIVGALPRGHATLHGGLSVLGVGGDGRQRSGLEEGELGSGFWRHGGFSLIDRVRLRMEIIGKAAGKDSRLPSNQKTIQGWGPAAFRIGPYQLLFQ